jgi:hypothetical protein
METFRFVKNNNDGNKEQILLWVLHMLFDIF